MHHVYAGAAARIAAAALLFISFAGTALADPPSRAIRFAYASGPVSFLPSGESEWVQAGINRPLWTGDRVWSDRGARAELQIGGATLFAAPETSLAVLDFDDRHAQFEITQGTVTVDVRSISGGDTLEIDTPNLAFVVRRPGQYRIDVAADGQSTAVGVVRGEGEASGANAAYVLRAGNRFRFYGNDLRDYDADPVAARDPFDSWVATRVSARDRSVSAQYVSPDMIGYADLDGNGTWRTAGNYGAVWVPTNVAADWAPYRYGHWTWVDPWGWTWVDDAAWGFAPFHYGRWAYVDNRYWGWVPGPRNTRPVYAPALVAFVGGDNFRISAASNSTGVAWFPLAPGEVYRPAYNASRDYFTRVNVTNTVVNVTNVTNVYNNPRAAQVRYTNVNSANGVTAVPVQAFVQAQPVQRAAVRVDRAALQNAPVTGGAAIAPVRASIVAAPAAQARPAPSAMQRAVVARQAPPAAPASFERREAEFKQQPGKPVDQPDRAKSAPAAQPNVKVVQAPAATQPVPPPPARSAGERRERTPVAQPAPAVPAQPRAEPAPAVPQQRAQPAAPPPVTAQPTPEQRRGPPEGRNAFNPGQQPAAKAPEPQRPAQAAPSPPVPAQAAQPARPPAVTAQPAPEQRRGAPEGGNAFNQRPEPAARAAPPPPPAAASAPVPAQRPAQAAPSPPVPAQAAQPVRPPAAMAQPAPEQGRGAPEGRNAFNPRPEPAPRAAAAPPPAAAPAPVPAQQAAPPPPPAVAQPAPDQRRGPPGNAQPQHAPANASPAPEAANQPSPAAQAESGRRAERAPPPAKGKDRDAEKDKKE